MKSPFKILRAALIIFSIQHLAFSLRAQTAIDFYLTQFTGTTNDTVITIAARQNPVIYNGQFYWMPTGGTNITTTNGFAQVTLIPGQYNVNFAGIAQSWTITVTNSGTPLNAIGLTTSTLIYSGINSINGNGVTSDHHGNYTVSATATNIDNLTGTNLNLTGSMNSTGGNVVTNNQSALTVGSTNNGLSIASITLKAQGNPLGSSPAVSDVLELLQNVAEWEFLTYPVQATNFIGAFTGNAAATTNQNVGNLAAGNTSTSNNWVGTFNGNVSGAGILSNQLQNVIAPTTPLGMGSATNIIFVDQVNGNDLTAQLNAQSLPCSNLQTAVWMIQSNSTGGGTIILTPGETFNLDNLGTGMSVSNNCSVTLIGDGCTISTTNNTLSPWKFFTNSTYIEHDVNWSLPFPLSPGSAALYETTGSGGGGMIDQELYGGSSFNGEDCWYLCTFGNNAINNTNNVLKFPRLTVFNHIFSGTWDIGLLSLGNKTVTNSLVQFVGCTFMQTNLAYNNTGGTMHGVSSAAAFTLLANCTFNFTNTSTSAWNLVPLTMSSHFAVINCAFNCSDGGGGGGSVTNVYYYGNGSGKPYFFPELYNCNYGTNLWLTGDGFSTTFLNIRTRDGGVYQHQIVP